MLTSYLTRFQIRAEFKRTKFNPHEFDTQAQNVLMTFIQRLYVVCNFFPHPTKLRRTKVSKFDSKRKFGQNFHLSKISSLLSDEVFVVVYT